MWNNCTCSLGLVTLPEATDCFGVFAVLNHDDARLDVCSACKTALSSQHSTDERETTAPVAWA